MTTAQDIRYIPTLDPKPYRSRCNFGQGHCWIVVGVEDDELCQCSRCGCMSSNWTFGMDVVPATLREQAVEEYDCLIAEGYEPSMIRFRYVGDGIYRVAGYQVSKRGITVGCDRYIGQVEK